MESEPGIAAGGSDAELITRVRAGDRAAFGTLYSRHAGAATNLARQFARSPAEVDDLVSESFARVLDALLGGRGPDTAFRAYLFTALRNTAFDRSRKDAKLQFTDDVAAHESAENPDDPVVLQLENTLVAKAFAALPERWQTVLWHTQVEGQSPAEVGVLLGVSANAVTSLTFRAREGLREAYLQAHLADTAAERCRSTVDRLGSWARGGLSQRERAQVDAHLDECDRCRALAAELAEINTGLRALLAPVLLGGAAAGYLATTSTSVAVPLVAAGAAGGAAVGAGAGTTAGAGAAAGAGAGAGAAAAGGSGSSGGGVLSFLARPWTIAAGGAGVAAAAVVAVVIAVSGAGGEQPLADQPPVVTPVATPVATSSSATSTAVTTSAQPPSPTTRPVPPPPETPNSPTQEPSTASTTGAPTSPPATRPTSSQEVPPPVVYSTNPAPESTPPPPESTPASQPPTSSPVPSTTSPAPTPATLSDATFSSPDLQATAGAPAVISFSVTNTGDTDSATQNLRVSAPAGITVSGVTGSRSSAAPALRRAPSALLAPATDPSVVDCANTGRCRYTVPALSTVSIEIALDVAPDARSGDISVLINGNRAGDPLPVSVAPGITSLVLGNDSTDWVAGRTIEGVELTATVAPEVTQPGTVILPVRQADLWITDYPDTCTVVRAAALTCAGALSGNGRADFGRFAVTVLPGANGPQPITAELPGGQSMAVVSGQADDKPIVAAPLPAGGPINMTGHFGGTIVGASAMECSQPHVTRGDCQDADFSWNDDAGYCADQPADTDDDQDDDQDDDDQHDDQDDDDHGHGHGHGYGHDHGHDDDRSCMIDAPHPQSLTVPPGATVISATLTWAATAPADGEPGSLDEVDFHFQPDAAGCASSCVHHLGEAASRPPVPDEQGKMYVRSADVTAWVTGSGRVWATGIEATRTDAGTTPMAGWALTVIWSGPLDTTTTVTATNPGSYSLSSDPPTERVSLAAAGDPINRLDTVVWAADPWADKHIVVEGKNVEPAPIRGVRPGQDDRDGNDGHSPLVATGVDVLRGITAPRNAAVTFTNDQAPETSPWGFESYQDGLWIGPTLVVRAAGTG